MVICHRTRWFGSRLFLPEIIWVFGINAIDHQNLQNYHLHRWKSSLFFGNYHLNSGFLSPSGRVLPFFGEWSDDFEDNSLKLAKQTKTEEQKINNIFAYGLLDQSILRKIHFRNWRILKHRPILQYTARKFRFGNNTLPDNLNHSNTCKWFQNWISINIISVHNEN